MWKQVAWLSVRFRGAFRWVFIILQSNPSYLICLIPLGKKSVICEGQQDYAKRTGSGFHYEAARQPEQLHSHIAPYKNIQMLFSHFGFCFSLTNKI